jgi:T5SS/PEP-CTERM-associated repeat protein
VGDGAQPATFVSLGGGTCNFTNGLLVRAGGALKGVGPVVGGAAVGVVITNGATMSAGVSGAGTLALGNTTWHGGGTTQVEIVDISGVAGVGYDLITINGTLTQNPNGGKFWIRMDSLGGDAGFASDQNYDLKIVSCAQPTTFNLADFQLDTSAFTPGGAWWVTNVGNDLYLKYTGAAVVVADYTWKAPTSGVWSVGANWQGGSSPSAGNYTLGFPGSGSAAYGSTNDLGDNFLVNRLLLASSSSATNVIGGQSLTLANADAGILQSAGGAFLITNRLGWTAPISFSGSGLGAVTLSGPLAGTGAVTVTTKGPLTLASSNSFSGDVLVNCSGSGQLRVAATNALGANHVTVSNGTLATTVNYKFGDANEKNRRGLVAGSKSFWTNSGSFYVGGAAGATNNSLLVTSSGTLYAATLYIGDGSPGYNSMIVSNGGQVVAGSSSMGTSGASNSVVVTGTGSVFRAGVLTMAGTGSVARVEHGGVISNAFLQMAATAVDGSLFITSGAAFTSPDSYTASWIDGRSGRVLVSGAGSRFNPAYGVTVGYAGGSNCELRVENGASATTVNPTGGYGYSVTVGGGTAASSMNRLIVDDADCNTYRLYLGYYAGSYGNTAVLTNGAVMTMLHGNYGTYVGYGNNANSNSFAIGAGSVYNGSGGLFDVGVGSLVTGNRALLDGGAVTNVSVVEIGVGGTNSANMLIVTNGGILTLDGATGARIGSGTGSYSNVIAVSASGILNARGYPIAVGAGTNTWDNRLAIGSDGSVTNVGTLTVGMPTGTGNQLRLTGGSLTVSNLVASNANNTIDFAAGTLNLRGGFVSNGVPFVAGDGTQAAMMNLTPGGICLFADGLTIAAKATLTGAGTIQAATTVSGTNSPGSGIGTITNIGAFTLANSAVTMIELAAYTTPGAGWDLLAVTNGTLTLDGKLWPVLAGGFTPTNTQSYVIMTNLSGTVVGTFGNIANSRVNAYSNNLTTILGSFRVGVSNQYVVLSQYSTTPRGSAGSTYIFR